MKSALTILTVLCLMQCKGLSQKDFNPADISSWLGIWSGELMIYNATGLSQTVPMKIKHFKTDTAGVFGWYLIYGDDEEKGTRAYYLNTVDENKGHYQVDEKNSIYLDTYLINNKMISNFEVQNSAIQSIYTLLPDGDMEFEIIFSNSEEKSTSGGTHFNGEEIPEVYSYKVGGYQYALLEKVME